MILFIFHKFIYSAYLHLLTGESGAGKSAIAAHLIQIRTDIIAYHFCLADDINTLKSGEILRSLSAIDSF